MSQPTLNSTDKTSAGICFVLDVLAILFLAIGLLIAIIPFLGLSHPFFQGATVINSFLIFGGCIVIAALLAFCAQVLKLLTVQIYSAQNTASSMRPSAFVVDERSALASPAQSSKRPDAASLPLAALPPRPSLDNPSLPADQQILELLRQLRDLSMMNEHQRAEYAQAHFERRKEALLPQIELAMAAFQWDVATAHAQELKSILSDNPLGQQMLDRIQSEQSARLTQEVEAARFQLQHLMSITAWPQAQEIITSLQQKYPYAVEIETLAQDFQRERDAFESENIQRLIQEVKEASDRRNWKQALTIAQELIQRYPDDKRVERLRIIDLPTLHENAEAQERREEEETFKDLLHRQRYEEALVVARRVITKHPASHAAAELAKLIPKVEELLQHEKQKKIVV